MAYTAQQLVTDAFYLSGVVSKGLETLEGGQLSEGISLLNDVLAVKTGNIALIPYYQEYDLTATIGQEGYFIPKLLLISTLTFNIGDVRYSMIPQGRDQYFGTGRVDNIESLPGVYRVERKLGGSQLYIYFLPQAAYPLKLWGKFGLDSVTATDNLEETYERYYIVYMRYALAEYLCEQYNIAFQPGADRKLREFENMIMDVSVPDLTMRKFSTLTADQGINYGQANLGRGWTRPGL